MDSNKTAFLLCLTAVISCLLSVLLSCHSHYEERFGSVADFLDDQEQCLSSSFWWSGRAAGEEIEWAGNYMASLKVPVVKEQQQQQVKTVDEDSCNSPCFVLWFVPWWKKQKSPLLISPPKHEKPMRWSSYRRKRLEDMEGKASLWFWSCFSGQNWVTWQRGTEPVW